MSTQTDFTRDQELRHQAVRRLKKRRDFYAHLILYLLVNGFLVGIWAITSAGFFWPIFIIGAWGIGLLLNAWDVFARQNLTEDRIQREMHRLQQH